MKDIYFSESEYKRGKIIIFVYVGEGDPVHHLDNAIYEYTRNNFLITTSYNEFIDANMDNPWTRVIITGLYEIGINDIE